MLKEVVSDMAISRKARNSGTVRCSARNDASRRIQLCNSSFVDF